MFDKAFAKAVRRLRTLQGLSQEEFGEESGLHRTYVSQLERGLKSPSLRTMQRIAGALGIKLSELITIVEQESETLHSAEEDGKAGEGAWARRSEHKGVGVRQP
jgi:transcriptional regulator with XRE-family HTH domain